MRIEALILVLCAVLGWPVLSHSEDLSNVAWIDCFDGDTCSFDVLLPAVFGSAIGVRFTGIDAPEIAGKCQKEKDLAKVAKDFLKAQLDGATVVLHDVFRDKYFRLEARVTANGVNLNQLLIEKGYAVPYGGSGPRKDWCAS